MSRARPYLFAIAVVVAASLGGALAAQHASLADEAMLYSLAIVIAAHAGRGPGLVAAALSVIAFDFVFVEPRYTLAVADTRFLFTFLVMFAVGAAIGTLTVRLRAAEAASREREHQTAVLLAFTREAADATDVAGVEAALERCLRANRQPLLVEAVTRQAAITIEKLGLAVSARE